MKKKTEKEKILTTDEAAVILGIDTSLVVDENSFGDFAELRTPIELWERYTTSDPNVVYFLPAVEDKYVRAANIHCQNNLMSKRKSDGYGGSTWKFKCTDGKVYEVQGPWHSNCDSLFLKTGIDLRNMHKFCFMICEKSSYDIISDNRRLSGILSIYDDPDDEYAKRQHAASFLWKYSSYRFQGYKLLHRFEWSGSWDMREYQVAKLVIEHGHEVYFTIQSSGGASTSYMSLEQANEIRSKMTKKLDEKFFD